MGILETLIGPITSIIDKVIPDKEARALEGVSELLSEVFFVYHDTSCVTHTTN